MKGKGRVRLVGTVREEPESGDRELTFRRREFSCNRASEAHDREGELVLDLSRASPGGAQLPGGTRVPARRRGPCPQPGRRPGDEHRHRRRREPGVEARRRAERRRRRTVCSTPTSWSASASRGGWSPQPIASSPSRRRKGASPGFVRTRLVPLLVPLLFRLPGARRFLFRTVSQTGIQYRDSPLTRRQRPAPSGAVIVCPGSRRRPTRITSPR